MTTRLCCILLVIPIALSCKPFCFGDGAAVREHTQHLQRSILSGMTLGRVAALAAQAGEQFDLQVTECGPELPLRAGGYDTRFWAYRGGFSPPPEGDEPGFREAKYSSVAALQAGIDDDLAKGLACKKAFIGLFSSCHAYGFALALGDAGTVRAVESVAPWG